MEGGVDPEQSQVLAVASFWGKKEDDLKGKK